MYAHYLVMYASDEALADTLPRLLPAHVEPTVLGVVTY
jgi:hypothetical protein